MKHLQTIALIAIISLSTATGALADPEWTWEAGKQTNNGAITVKSMSGGTTYSGTQNPTGAVAKTNQSAVTQPPTVIIQSTGGTVPECVPKLVTGDPRPAIPTCPTGYHAVWSDQSTATKAGVQDSCPAVSGNYGAYNIGGSNLNFVAAYNSSNASYRYRMFALSGSLTYMGNQVNVDATTEGAMYSGTYTYPWSATVCCK